MNLSNQDIQIGQGMFISSSTQQHPLGARGSDDMGRVYRYCRAGASDLVMGTVQQGSAVAAGGLTLAVHTTSGGTAPGSQSIMVTCVSAISTGFYNDGLLMVASGSGAGGVFKIQSFGPAFASASGTPFFAQGAVSTGATGEFRLYFEDAIPVMTNMTISTSSKISLIPNAYNGVVQAPVTTLTGPIAGICVYPITTLQFGWLQTWGPCAVLSNDTTALGNVVVGVAATTGRIEGAVGGTTGATILGNLMKSPIIGYMMAVGVQAEWRPVFLTISP
jgi:hypothetical protein